jgi:hypothetical protein
MKRLLSVLFLVIAMARISSGQTMPHVSVDFTQTAIYKIVDAVAADKGFRIEGKLPADRIDIKSTDQPLDAVLAQILEPHGYGFIIDVQAKTIKVYEASMSTRTESQPIGSSPLRDRRAIVDQLLARYPQAYNSDGLPGNFDQLTQLELELQSSQPRNSYPIAHTAGGGYPSPGYYGGQPPPAYGYGFLGGEEFLNYSYVQGMIDRDTWGALKFKKGREGLMQNIEVWGCGKRVAQADEGNNIWDHKILVPVNCTPLNFRYSDGKDDWEVEINEMIVPLRLQSAKNITIDREFFNRARKLTVYQKYTMVEQPDGSFKRTPR